MTSFEALIAFTLAAGLVTLTPGLDTALVLRTATVEGPRRAFMAGLGVCAGCLAWGLIVSLGLGAFLAASEAGYTALRWAGAVYLIYLGARLILNARAGFSEIEPADANTQHSATQHGTAHSSANWFLRGFLTNMLNPKVGAFYVAFLPQFIPASIQPGADLVTFSVLLAGIHAVEGIAWFALLISATQPLMSLLRRPTVLRTLDRVTGGVLIAFGLKLLWDVRRV